MAIWLCLYHKTESRRVSNLCWSKNLGSWVPFINFSYSIWLRDYWTRLHKDLNSTLMSILNTAPKPPGFPDHDADFKTHVASLLVELVSPILNQSCDTCYAYIKYVKTGQDKCQKMPKFLLGQNTSRPDVWRANVGGFSRGNSLEMTLIKTVKSKASRYISTQATQVYRQYPVD